MIFSPVSLPHITLPGRMVRSATEFFCADENGHIPQFELDAYEKLAKQPLGMIITAHTCVSPEGRSNKRQNAAWSDEYLDECTVLAKTAKSGGVPVIMQLGHGGMKAEGNNGGLPVYTPDSMTTDEIRGVIRAFGRAAKLAKDAGFDGMMLHGAHMYLLSQCFYPEYNHRTDAYGGSAENRFRIVREAALEVKKTCGDDFPVFLKINGDDRNNTEDYHRDLVTALRVAQECGIEAAEISGWSSARAGNPDSPYFIGNVRRLADEVEIPLIEVGGIRTRQQMLDVLDAGACAFSVSRPLICDPDFPTKLKNGAADESMCTGCCKCFCTMDLTKKHRCAQFE
ncbi:MAG: NADH:flavin oxidoreductase [Clostridia bacterium]|nr:NADH:flavin oxidoreductase [Clostridia bacterium]MBQ8368591.1 NADH:flavin oxidoreductase [Clostridia bacterium]